MERVDEKLYEELKALENKSDKRILLSEKEIYDAYNRAWQKMVADHAAVVHFYLYLIKELGF